MNFFAFRMARLYLMLAASLIILQYLPDINNNSTPAYNVHMLFCWSEFQCTQLLIYPLPVCLTRCLPNSVFERQSNSHFFEIDNLWQCDFGIQIRTMAGMHRTGVQGFHVRYGTLKLLFRRIQQMKTADNINHPIIATDLFCVLYDVADSSMGAPRDYDQTIWRLVG